MRKGLKVSIDQPNVVAYPNLLRAQKSTRGQGFSFIELLIAVSIIAILGGMAIPLTLNTINGIKIRNEAVDFDGVVQAARMQAVRKNTFYSLLANGTGNDIAYFADLQKSGTYAAGDPVVQWRSVTVFGGTGSGAPGEATFEGSLGFGFNPGLPSMDARGLPCAPTVLGTTCPETPGNGFIVYFSNTTTFGSTNWAALVVTPSGRAQVWSYDGTANWIQG